MCNKDSHLNSKNIFSNLPVFQISGGTEEERRDFVKRLQIALQGRSLSSTFLKPEEFQTAIQYAALLQAQLHDLVIVDAGIENQAQQIRIGGQDGGSKLGSLAWTGSDDLEMKEITDRLVEKINGLVQQTPVWGCVLIGGKSSRMGRPKHLIKDQNNITWLERITEILCPLVDGMVVSGAGVLPEKLIGITRLADIPGVAGPLTGILAASRWQPTVSWLLIACDMPYITTETIRWLLAERRCGIWGRVPRLAGNNHCEPLFAWYDFRAAQIFEEQVCSGNLRIGAAASHPKIENPLVPESLTYGWQNINRPDQL
jgi:molybdopterin-guanine dinucleotide biosynthesis protein A